MLRATTSRVRENTLRGNKLKAEATWQLDYQRLQTTNKLGKSNARAQNRIDDNAQEAIINMVVDDLCSTRAPIDGKPCMQSYLSFVGVSQRG